MTITGKILRIEKTELLGEKKYPKRKFYLDRSRKDQFSDAVFPNVNEVTLLGDKNVVLIDSYQVGDIVDITADIKGDFFMHEEKQKFSQDLNCWAITLRKKGEPQSIKQDGTSVYSTK